MKLSIDTYGNVLAENARTLRLNGFALSCGMRDEEAIENTRHIVHCVNSHDELVRQSVELRAALIEADSALEIEGYTADGATREAIKNVLNSYK